VTDLEPVRCAAGLDEDRRRVPSVGHHQAASPGIGDHVDHAGELTGAELIEKGVHPLDHVSRAKTGQGVRQDRDPQPAHRCRSGDAMAGDVAHDQADPVGVQLEHVVPVAAAWLPTSPGR
jgi:hypothetical protein